MGGQQLAPLVGQQGPVGLDGVLERLAGAAGLLGQGHGPPEEVDAHEGGLAPLPGHRHLAVGLGGDVLAEVGRQHVVGHAEPVAGVERLLGQEEAVLAVEVADRPGRLGQDVERRPQGARRQARAGGRRPGAGRCHLHRCRHRLDPFPFGTLTETRRRAASSGCRPAGSVSLVRHYSDSGTDNIGRPGRVGDGPIPPIDHEDDAMDPDALPTISYGTIDREYAGRLAAIGPGRRRPGLDGQPHALPGPRPSTPTAGRPTSRAARPTTGTRPSGRSARSAPSWSSWPTSRSSSSATTRRGTGSPWSATRPGARSSTCRTCPSTSSSTSTRTPAWPPPS